MTKTGLSQLANCLGASLMASAVACSVAAKEPAGADLHPAPTLGIDANGGHKTGVSSGSASSGTAADNTEACGAAAAILNGSSSAAGSACQCTRTTPSCRSGDSLCAVNWEDASRFPACDPQRPLKPYRAKCGALNALIVQGRDTLEYLFFDATGAPAGEAVRMSAKAATCEAYSDSFALPQAACAPLSPQTPCAP